ncbi:toll/interleukin-1 receptor domain-containing protein [Clostridium sp. CS001]|uniref:toll/interleukin-1 receptor domain-containing protein n=1 Tax=Clostridium sp. CS001 TaxID=2880648 RepID=UPI001CF2D20E|nr:toll/interleukin-1 receptor domain-containing protein [Clostridium sp. CS001]MCB2290878.1 toll/interleukin-1 receptor domain-containing protein [Clostridium sp. CS001]
MNEKDFLFTLKEYISAEGKEEILALLKDCQLNFNYTSVFATKSYQFRAYVDLRVPVINMGRLKEFQSEINKYCGDIFMEDEQYAYFGVEIKPQIMTSKNDSDFEKSEVENVENNDVSKLGNGTIKVSNKTVEALAQTITGDNGKSFYRKGYELVKFFNELGFNDTYGQGFPSRIDFTRERTALINENEDISSVFENLLDPRDYIDSTFTVDSIAQYLNQYLKYDGLELTKVLGFYKLCIAQKNKTRDLDKLIAVTEQEVVEKKPPKDGVTVFFSYSHKDEAMRDELEKHLIMLKRKGVINTWHDRRIDAGSVLNAEIDDNLKEADIILLLISVDFLVSDYCYDIEMNKALEMHESKQAVIVPIILRNCDWHSAPFAKLLALPTDGKSVSTWADLDAAFLNIAKGIENIATKL